MLKSFHSFKGIGVRAQVLLKRLVTASSRSIVRLLRDGDLEFSPFNSPVFAHLSPTSFALNLSATSNYSREFFSYPGTSAGQHTKPRKCTRGYPLDPTRNELTLSLASSSALILSKPILLGLSQPSHRSVPCNNGLSLK